MHPGRSRSGVSLMRPGMKGLRGFGLLTGSVMMFAALATSAYPEDAPTTENMVSQLAGLETSPDVEVIALRQQVVDRVKSRADAPSLKRPPVAAELAQAAAFQRGGSIQSRLPIIRPNPIERSDASPMRSTIRACRLMGS